MFARAAIVGRVARERSEARRKVLQHKQELRKKTPQAPLRQRCFIPLLRGPCMMVAFGFFLIFVGAILCNFAFHARELSTTRLTNGLNETVSETVINRGKYEALRSLTFIGPSLMGLGIFVIIIACVLLLDKRDKILKDYIDSIIRNQQELSMELSYRAASSAELFRSKAPSVSSYLEQNELQPSTSQEVKMATLVSRTFRNAMEDIEEVPCGHEIELTPLANQSQSSLTDEVCHDDDDPSKELNSSSDELLNKEEDGTQK